MAIYVNNNLTQMTINDPQMSINNIHVSQVQKAFTIIYMSIREEASTDCNRDRLSRVENAVADGNESFHLRLSIVLSQKYSQAMAMPAMAPSFSLSLIISLASKWPMTLRLKKFQHNPFSLNTDGL